jgi:SEC-C motif-containing protein
MRSRYCAFAVRDIPYLVRTHHPDTRPAGKALETDRRWTGLEILDTTDGSPFHSTGFVTFRAHFTQRGQRGVQHERSRFARHDGVWVYVDGALVS